LEIGNLRTPEQRTAFIRRFLNFKFQISNFKSFRDVFVEEGSPDMRSFSSPCRWWLGVILGILIVARSQGGPIRSGFADGAIPASDDGKSGAIDTAFAVNFYGETHTQVYVNNNGNLTFGSNLDQFTPVDLSSTSHQIIAPFFADVDTTSRGMVTYGTGLVDGRMAFGATWSDVGYYIANDNKGNTFQVVLVDRSDRGVGSFDIEFNYDTIQWETGDFSGGVDGLGGDSARVGFAKGTGDPGTFFELPGSGVNGAFLDGTPGSGLVGGSLNADVDGRYVFYARGGVITSEPEVIDDPDDGGGGTPTVPEPATLALASMSLGMSGVFAWRKRRREG